jgi:hypothetical protein
MTDLSRRAVTDPVTPSAGLPPGIRHPGRLVALVVVVALLIPTAVSYGRALTAPGNDSWGIRSTEWLRSHHFRWLVNDVENFWYTHHQPKKGGVPTGAVGAQITSSSTAGNPTAAQRATATAAAAQAARNAAAKAAAAVLPPPAAVAPFVTDPLPNEGQWQPLGTPVHGQPAMYATYLRPDAVHTSLVAALAWIDPKLVTAAGYAGVAEPGGTWTQEAPIPENLRPSLLAAFNSGFKMADANGGYYADGRYARPLRAGQATAWITSDGVLHVGEWGRDATMTPDVVFARQNLALIVDGGKPVADVLTGGSAKWGATVGNAVLVWRSGLGVTADGAIVYAAGAGLSALTLAQLLARAGVVRGMELDINSAWVDFFTYAPAAPGHLPSQLTVNRLLADMHPSTSDYLTGSSRDFFALFARP